MKGGITFFSYGSPVADAPVELALDDVTEPIDKFEIGFSHLEGGVQLSIDNTDPDNYRGKLRLFEGEDELVIEFSRVPEGVVLSYKELTTQRPEVPG